MSYEYDDMVAGSDRGYEMNLDEVIYKKSSSQLVLTKEDFENAASYKGQKKELVFKGTKENVLKDILLEILECKAIILQFHCNESYDLLQIKSIVYNINDRLSNCEIRFDITFDNSFDKNEMSCKFYMYGI